MCVGCRWNTTTIVTWQRSWLLHFFRPMITVPAPGVGERFFSAGWWCSVMLWVQRNCSGTVSCILARASLVWTKPITQSFSRSLLGRTGIFVLSSCSWVLTYKRWPLLNYPLLHALQLPVIRNIVTVFFPLFRALYNLPRNALIFHSRSFTAP